MNKKVIKEVFIIALLFMVIMFTLGILFYDCLSSDIDKINSIEYIADDNITKTINEIKSSSGVDIANEEKNSLLKSYSINRDDLNEYASKNSYESGKKDPFAESSEPIEETVTTTTTGAKINNSQNANPVISVKDNTEKEPDVSNKNENTTVPNNENKTNENKTTTGTFFENKSSK